MQPTDQAGGHSAADAGEALKDLIFGLLLLGVGVFALVWIKLTPAGFGAPASTLDFASVPVLCSVLLIGLSAIYAAGALLKLILMADTSRQWAQLFAWRPTVITWRRLATIVALVAYVFALRTLPFFVATALLLAAMFLAYGQRSPIWVAAVSLLGSAALTGLFVYSLRLPI